MIDETQLTSAEVMAMTWPQREARLERLIADAWQLVLRDSRSAHLRIGQRVNARCVLFSGGDDSTVLAHLFRNYASHAIHANTGIGIEETRQFVRDTCKEWDLPLIEEYAGDWYERWVIEHGFPGPGMHEMVYQRLKERALDAAKRKLDRVHRSRTNRVMYIAGRRREESTRRAGILLHEMDGATLWVSPFAIWTKADLATYRRVYDCPRNMVSVNIHMSGECLCGCYAHEGELDEIGFFYPHVVEYIRHLEHRVVAAGRAPADRCQWGKPRPDEIDTSEGRACGNCAGRAVVAG